MAPCERRRVEQVLWCCLLLTHRLALAKSGTPVRRGSFWSPTREDDDWHTLPGRLCFSCASENYKSHWDVFKRSIRRPSNFTVLCRQPRHAPFLALETCSGPCATIIEDDYIFGVQVDHSYIRGCADSLFLVERKDFIPQAMVASENFCNLLPRQMLFPNDQRQDESVMVCFCANDRCNVYPDQAEPSGSSAVSLYKCGNQVVPFLLAYGLITGFSS
uniref:TGF-beta family profile domain-containing protein n=1 Tax=Trichuris muris TaxID=70415 RepID=A0A5S6R596_TRIMR